MFAPGPEDEEIEEIAAKLREAAGLPKEPTGVVAQNADGSSNGEAEGNGVMDKIKDATS